MDRPSRLFVGYRALGFVSNNVPMCVRYDEKRRENLVVTCVGRAFHTYNVSCRSSFIFFSHVPVHILDFHAPVNNIFAVVTVFCCLMHGFLNTVLLKEADNADHADEGN